MRRRQKDGISRDFIRCTPLYTAVRNNAIMEIILKHLSGDQQYKLLQALLVGTGAVSHAEAPAIIQRIMDEVNAPQD